MFSLNQFKIAGSQIIVKLHDFKSFDMLKSTVIERINNLLQRYGSFPNNINYIILTFVNVNFNFVSKYRLVDTDDVVLNKFI